MKTRRRIISHCSIVGMVQQPGARHLFAAMMREHTAQIGTGYPMQNLPLSDAALLVVEDEPLVALDLRQNLESAGAYVFAATQLPHALQLAGHPDISAAVLDYRLADGDCTPICALLSQRGIPFVFYSGYDDARQNWPEAAHVQKPADATKIVQAVAAALANSPSSIARAA